MPVTASELSLRRNLGNQVALKLNEYCLQFHEVAEEMGYADPSNISGSVYNPEGRSVAWWEQVLEACEVCNNRVYGVMDDSEEEEEC